MLATIIEDISSDLDGFSAYSWIATTYPIGLSLTQPLSGQLTDLFGRRRGLVFCLAIFTAGQLLCGFAPRLWVFLLGRVVQGLGGGCIGTITAFVETDLVPMRKRALIEGIGNITYGVTLALGGVYGGAIANSLGWRWAFFIQAPFIVLDIAMVAFWLRIPQPDGKPTRRQIDYVGMLILLATIILFQFGMNTGGSTFSWDSAVVLATCVAAGVVFICFICWELYGAGNPLVPIRALMQRSVASSQMSSFFSSFANIAIVYYTPIYLEVLGFSSASAGLRFIPLALCFAVGSFVTGYFVKVTASYYYINIPVQVLTVLGSTLLCTMTESTPSWVPFVYLGIYGLGSGSAYVTRLMGQLNSTDQERQAVVQAASFTIRNTGTTLGQTVSAALFQNLSVAAIQMLLKGQSGVADQPSRDYDVLTKLPVGLRQQAINIYLDATRAVFILTTATLVAAACCSFCMQNKKIQ